MKPSCRTLLCLSIYHSVSQAFRDDDGPRAGQHVALETLQDGVLLTALQRQMDCPPWLHCGSGVLPAASEREVPIARHRGQHESVSWPSLLANGEAEGKLHIAADISAGALPDVGQLQAAVKNLKAEDFDPRQHRMALYGEACGVVIVLALMWKCCCRSRPHQVYTAGGAGGGKTAEGSTAEANTGEEGQAADSEDPALQRLKKLKHRLLMEQAINKSKLEKIIEEIASMQALAAAGGLEVMTAEEVEKQVAEATKAHELMTQRGLVTAVAYVAPFAMQGKRLAAVLDSRLQQTREKAFAVVAEEVKALGKDVYDVMDLKDRDIFNFSQFGSIDLPSVALLIASAFAPGQLRMLHMQNFIFFLVKLLLVIVDGVVIFVDKDRECGGDWLGDKQPNDVIIWFYADFFVAAFCCIVRFVVMRAVGSTLRDIERPPPVSPDNPIQAVKALVEYYLTTGGEALIRLDTVTSSNLYGSVGWAMLFDFLWAAVGVDIILNVSFVSCPNLSIAVLRIRELLFLVLFLPFLVAIVLWFVSRALGSDSVFIQLYKVANKIDQHSSLGFPFAKLLLQVWFVRNTYDMMNLELKVLKMDEDQLAREQEKLEKELQKVKDAYGQVQSEVEKVEGRMQEAKAADSAAGGCSLETEHERAKQRILEESEKFFVMVNDQSKKAADEAAKQVEEWEAGDGPEVLKALAKGDGVSFAQQCLGELQQDVSAAVADSGFIEELSAQSSAAAAQLGQLAESEAVKGLTEQGLQAAAQLQEESSAMLSQAASSEMLRETLEQGASLTEQAQAAAASAAEQTLAKPTGQ